MSEHQDFPTDTSGLPRAVAPSIVELADGDETELHIGPVVKRIGDADVRMLAYNGSIPGPTLEVPEDATVTVHVRNDGDLEATVHWHGLRLENRFDGTHDTQAPIPVGETFTYEVHVPDPGAHEVFGGASGDAAAVEADLARRADHPAHGTQRRRLAGAVRAEEAEDLAALHLERDAIEGSDAAEALDQSVEDEGHDVSRVAGRRPSGPVAGGRRVLRAIAIAGTALVLLGLPVGLVDRSTRSAVPRLGVAGRRRALFR